MAARLKSIRVARWMMLYLLISAWVLATGKCMGDAVDVPWALGRYIDLNPLLSPPVWLSFGAVYLAAAIAFALSVREHLAGAVLFVGLGVIGSAEMCVRDNYMPSLDILLAGNMVLAWLLGSSFGDDAFERGRRGHEWMCGVFAAMLTLSGLSKLRNGGMEWLDGGMHSLYIWERSQPMLGLEALRSLRLFIADHPTLCTAGASFTLAVECFAAAFLFQRLRKAYAFLITVMFLGMDVLLGFGEPGWMQLPLVLAFSSLAPKLTPD